MSQATKRRQNGDGTIRKRKNGIWEGRIPIGKDPSTGKTKYKYLYAATLTELKSKIRIVVLDPPEIVTPNGRYVKIGNSHTDKNQMTFAEWIDYWLKTYKLNSISHNTYDSYKTLIENHIKPGFGAVLLAYVTPDMIQVFLNSKLMQGARLDKNEGALSSSSVTKMRMIIISAFKQAVKNRIISENPADNTTPPKLIYKDMRVFTVDEQKKFLDAIRGHEYEALFTTALATGMRKGELLALTWDCIDLSNLIITINKSVNRVRDPITEETTICVGPPKSQHSKRRIPFLPSVVPLIEKHRESQLMKEKTSKKYKNTNNLVFCSSVGTHIEPHRVNTTLGKMISKAGIEHINFHALRHTFATRALENGISAKVVAEILGHSDVSLTLNRYTHLLEVTSHDEMMKMNNLFV